MKQADISRQLLKQNHAVTFFPLQESHIHDRYEEKTKDKN